MWLTPFNLFVDERKYVALGVLTQKAGPWERPIAYLSKTLDPVTKGWASYLCSLAATALLIWEVNRLWDKNLTVQFLHVVLELLNSQGHHWLSNSHFTQYQRLLVENPWFMFQLIKNLNSPTYLFNKLGPPDHDCLILTNKLFNSRPKLQIVPDQCRVYLIHKWIRDRKQPSGYVVVTTKEAPLAWPFPQNWSAQ